LGNEDEGEIKTSTAVEIGSHQSEISTSMLEHQRIEVLFNTGQSKMQPHTTITSLQDGPSPKATVSSPRLSQNILWVGVNYHIMPTSSDSKLQ
jgi:hypothetical protein